MCDVESFRNRATNQISIWRSILFVSGIILRPGFIYGTCCVGSMKLPLGVIGSPLEMVLQRAKPLTQVPLIGPLFSPPVNATAVAKVAIRAAIDPSCFSSGHHRCLRNITLQPAEVNIDLLNSFVYP
ncbi:unnamed protein product [Ilex paraguariensis]|uniref:Uncharacterized protein n=1 Tax=Ilex paraguariensis TaxID=185542 RepID=A0ABC8UEP6_9AQUA